MVRVACQVMRTGQSHESKLLTRPVVILIAPEAQWWLAPRFSVGKGANNSQLAPLGAAQNGELVIKITFMRLPCAEVKRYIAMIGKGVK